MNGATVTDLPLSNLQRQRKDDQVIELQVSVTALLENTDPRWTDAQLLAVHIEARKLSTFLRSLKP